MKDCVNRFKKTKPGESIYSVCQCRFSHSAEGIFGITCLNEQNDLKIVPVEFADQQNGKSICDRRAVHIKGSIRKYVIVANNVTPSFEGFFNAVTKTNIKNIESVCLSRLIEF